MASLTIKQGDARETLAEYPDDFFACIVTSPPYNTGLTNPRSKSGPGGEPPEGAKRWAARYPEGWDDNMPVGEYVRYHRGVLRELLRVLHPEGLLWYVHSRKNLGVISGDDNDPARKPLVDWVLREFPVRGEIVWNKKTGMGFAAAGRTGGCYYPTVKTENIFLMAKTKAALMDRGIAAAGNVWEFPRQKGYGGHHAAFPVALAERCIAATLQEGPVLDPFAGSGTTGVAARAAGRDCVLIELFEEYVNLITERLG